MHSKTSAGQKNSSVFGIIIVPFLSQVLYCIFWDTVPQSVYSPRFIFISDHHQVVSIVQSTILKSGYYNSAYSDEHNYL